MWAAAGEAIVAATVAEEEGVLALAGSEEATALL